MQYLVRKEQVMLIRFIYYLPTAFGQFFRFVLIMAIIGPMMFVIGELLPRKNFDYATFPFRSADWERGGEVYHCLGIQKWKDHIPDMSKYVKTMFAKQMVSRRDPEYTRRLVLETCVAELTHFILILLSPIFLLFMEDIYGYVAMLVYILGNIPFIIVQRYNRPRLIRLMEKQLASMQRTKQKAKAQ